jgi:hypothetical protein
VLVDDLLELLSWERITRWRSGEASRWRGSGDRNAVETWSRPAFRMEELGYGLGTVYPNLKTLGAPLHL